MNAGGQSTVPPECTAGAKRCDPSGSTAQTCSAAGKWEGTPCQFVCSNGACGGVCTPGARQCSQSQPQRCNEMGAWVADGQPCSAQCENGVCTGACKNDATQCVSSTAVKTCKNGAWGTETGCQYACVQQNCGGECVPRSTRCASDKEVQTCNQSGQWANKQTCDAVCDAGSCAECKPNDRRCVNGQEDRCNNGKWEKSLTCPFVCSGTTCGGSCKPGETRCKFSSQAETCNAQGQWVDKNCPNKACVNGDCAACDPGSTMCDSKTKVKTCGNDGKWGAATECEFACTDDSCGGQCKPGTGTCDPSGKAIASVCDDNGNLNTVKCTGQDACQAGKCGDFPRYVFVTSGLYTADMGGLEGADNRCKAHAQRAGLSGQFKAFLLDSKTTLANRFRLDGGPFLMKDGTTDRLIAFDFYGLIHDQVLVPINRNESGAAAGNAILLPTPADFCDGGQVKTLVWGNITNSGGLASSDSTCNDWTRASASGAGFGNYADLKKWKNYCNMGRSGTSDPQYCKTQAPLLCIQN